MILKVVLEVKKSVLTSRVYKKISKQNYYEKLY